MQGYNTHRRSSDYCRNYYDDYCDYDHHYDFYRRSSSGKRYYDRPTIEETAININPYTNRYKQKHHTH